MKKRVARSAAPRIADPVGNGDVSRVKKRTLVAIERLNSVLAEAMRILGPREERLSKAREDYAERLKDLLDQVRLCHSLRAEEALVHYKAGVAKALDLLAEMERAESREQRAESRERRREIADTVEKVRRFMVLRVEQFEKEAAGVRS